MARKFLILITGIALLTLIGVFKGATQSTPAKNETPAETTGNALGNVPTDWKSYTSTVLKLSLRYPQNYTLTEKDGTLTVQNDPALVPSLTITRTAGIPGKVWGPTAIETHRVSRKVPSDPAFIVTSFSTGDPSTVRRYILFPKSYPESPDDTGVDAEGLVIEMLGGDARDPKDNLTQTLEKVIFSLQDLY